MLRKDFVNPYDNDNETLDKKEMELLRNFEIADDIIKELNDISESTINSLDEKIAEINQLIKKSEEIIYSLQTASSEVKHTHGNDKMVEELPATEKSGDFEIESPDNQPQELLKIVEMANRGYTPFQIAKTLNKGIGEINLVLNLKKR